MKKTILFAFAVAFFFAVAPTDIFACSCVPPRPVEEEYKAKFAVFSGKVIGITKLKNSHKVKIKVEKFWKGGLSKIVSIDTGSNGAICGFSFAVGGRYLIYADGESKKALRASLCSRTARASDAKEDLKILAELKS